MFDNFAGRITIPTTKDIITFTANNVLPATQNALSAVANNMLPATQKTLSVARKNALPFSKKILLYTVCSTLDFYTYWFGQLPAIPSLLKTYITDKNVKDLIVSSGQLVYQELRYAVILNVMYRYLEQGLCPDGNGLSAYNSCNDSTRIALNVVWVVLQGYNYRQLFFLACRELQLVMQNNFRSPPEVVSHLDNRVCKSCSKLRFFKGEIRDFVWLQLLKGALWQTSLLPGTSYLVFMLRTLVHGQYILGNRLYAEGICDRHRLQYFKQYVWLCFSLGLSSALTSSYIASMIEEIIRLPASVSTPWIETLLTVHFIGLAFHMNLPKAVEQSDHFGDLISGCKSVFNTIVDTFLDAIKNRKNENQLPIEAIIKYYDQGYQFLLNANTQLVIQGLAKLTLPSMLHSPKNLINHPFCENKWIELRSCILAKLAELKSVDQSNQWLGKFVTEAVLELGFKIPKPAIKIIMKLVVSKEFMERLDPLEEWITSLKTATEIAEEKAAKDKKNSKNKKRSNEVKFKIISETGCEPEKDVTFTIEESDNGVVSEEKQIDVAEGTSDDDVKKLSENIDLLQINGDQFIVVGAAEKTLNGDIKAAPYSPELFRRSSEENTKPSCDLNNQVIEDYQPLSSVVAFQPN